MARPPPARVRLANGDTSAMQQQERSDGEEAIQARVEDVGRAQ
jgi:hypothetical protein